MKNVCFLNSMKFWGGGEKLHYEFATGFKEKDYNVYLAVNFNSPLAIKAKKEQFSFFNISTSNLSFLNPVKLLRLVSFYRKHKIDTVVFSASQDLKLGAIAARIAGVPNIVYLRGLAATIKNSFLNRFLLRDAVSHIVANSNETKRAILENLNKYISDDKVKVIYHGIEISDEHLNNDQFLPAIEEQKKGVVLGNAGRLMADKGQHQLIEVAKKLKEREVNFTLFIAGTGELRPQLETMITRYGLQENVILLGFVENMSAFMRSVDVFLHLSRSEGFGFVLVEAMAHCKPVVAFDISSSSEIVTQDKTGFLASYPDINDFSEKTEALINNTQLRHQLGAAGKEDVENRFLLKDRITEFEQYLLSTGR